MLWSRLRVAVILALGALLATGCAEFRHDSAGFGGYFMTSLVENIGYRSLDVKEIYLSDQWVIARAELTQPTRNIPELIGSRFLVASRTYVDAQVAQTMARQKGKYLYVDTGPYTEDGIDQLARGAQGWIMWPNSLGHLEQDPSFEELLRLLSARDGTRHPAGKVPYSFEGKSLTVQFVYPHNVDTRSFWQERDYLVHRPVSTTLFKAVVVPPAMIIDTACLPVVGMVYFGALLNYAHGHVGP